MGQDTSYPKIIVGSSQPIPFAAGHDCNALGIMLCISVHNAIGVVILQARPDQNAAWGRLGEGQQGQLSRIFSTLTLGNLTLDLPLVPPCLQVVKPDPTLRHCSAIG